LDFPVLLKAAFFGLLELAALLLGLFHYLCKFVLQLFLLLLELLLKLRDEFFLELPV